MKGDERFARLQQAWNDALANHEPGFVLQALATWDVQEVGPAVAWVRSRLTEGENPGRWYVEWGSHLEWITDADDDPRADLIDTVRLEHQEFSAEQIRRLGRRARQIVELELEEVDEDEEQLAGLFPGEASWSRLRSLTIYDCEHNTRLMPGLAVTELPALKELRISSHWDAYKLAGASWLRTLEHLELTYGSRSAWLASIEMPEITELTIDARSSELEQLIELADRTRKPKLRRIQIERLPEDYVLPSIPGVELVRR